MNAVSTSVQGLIVRLVLIMIEFCRPLKSAGLNSFGWPIPGLCSLRSLTRGYYLPPLRGSLTVISREAEFAGIHCFADGCRSGR
jgi:hypothetical protein